MLVAPKLNAQPLNPRPREALAAQGLHALDGGRQRVERIVPEGGAKIHLKGFEPREQPQDRDEVFVFRSRVGEIEMLHRSV